MNLQEMMRQAQRLKAKIDQVQEEVGQKTAEGSAGGGMVVATANGKGEIVALRIEKSVVNPDDVEMLQDLAVAASNQALGKAKEMMQAAMSRATGGMPGMPGLF